MQAFLESFKEMFRHQAEAFIQEASHRPFLSRTPAMARLPGQGMPSNYRFLRGTRRFAKV
eukprot:4982239-Lingulodinium_polyedra.AAC.1